MHSKLTITTSLSDAFINGRRRSSSSLQSFFGTKGIVVPKVHVWLDQLYRAKVKPQAHLHLPIPSTSKSEPHSPNNEWFKFAKRRHTQGIFKRLNTGGSTKWALKLFDLWHKQRNETFPWLGTLQFFQHCWSHSPQHPSFTLPYPDQESRWK